MLIITFWLVLITIKNLQTSKKLKKYFTDTVGGQGKSLFGVPLTGSKITRTFNAHHLYTKFFVDMKGRTDPNAVFEYINARAAVIKEANKKNVIIREYVSKG